MSLCGATEKLVELTQSLGSTEEIIDGLVDKIPIRPEISQAAKDAAAIIAMAQDTAAIQSLVTSKLKQYLPEIEVPEEIKGLQSEVRSVVTKVTSAVATADEVSNDLKTLKTKYSGLDLGDVAIDDIPKLLKDGALDLNNLCQKIANWEETETGALVLKGIPITTPTKSAVADILGIQIPEIKDFVFKVDTGDILEKANKVFENIEQQDTVGI